jgi:hypothetical protein
MNVKTLSAVTIAPLIAPGLTARTVDEMSWSVAKSLRCAVLAAE